MSKPPTATTQQQTATAAVPTALPGDEPRPASGMEMNLGDFTRTEGLMKSLRLTLNNQIVIPVEEIAGGINDAARKFKMGDLEQANLDVARLYSSYQQKVSQWESQARGLEQQMRTAVAKNPKAVSIDTMNRMKSEQTAVRTRLATAEVHFRRLHQGLAQECTSRERQAVPGVPANFLAAFKAASLADRPEVVKRGWESVTPLGVTIRRAQAGGYAIQFDPRPPRGSLLFVLATGEILRLQELAAVVVVEDLETRSKSDMKVAAFVKLVQGGVWLLQPRFQT
jgi:hypothetical protein